MKKRLLSISISDLWMGEMHMRPQNKQKKSVNKLIVSVCTLNNFVME